MLGFPSPTVSEAATIGSVPTLLLLCHFLLQPAVAAWPRLGYVRHAVARDAPAHRLAPELFVEYAWWWHEFTRVTHAVVHDPSGFHAHVVGNVVLIVTAAWILLGLLTALGERRWFSFFYWELVVVAPIVGSYSFDLFGTTAHGYGASTVGFAFLGLVLVFGLSVLATHVHRYLGRRSESARRLTTDGGEVVDPVAVLCLVTAVGLVVVADLLAGSPATPVHQAGAGFGLFVGVVALPALGRRR